jgi:arylformamidase
MAAHLHVTVVMNLLRALATIVALTAMASAQNSASSSPAATHANLKYGPDERNVLDFWQAKSNGDKPTPLLIFIHGGGWAGGDKSDVPAKLLDFMLANGVSVASVNYRYTPKNILPAPVRDAARAVQFLRSKAAEWRIDPQRFGAYGISAGGTSSLWLAYHDDLADPRSSDPISKLSTRLRAVVGLSPQPCLEPAIIRAWVGDEVLKHPMMTRAVGAKKVDEMKDPKPEWVKLLREFSPITHVSSGDPPTLISNPRVDPLPAASAGSGIHHAIFGVKLKEKCDAAGVTCVLRIEEKADAGMPTPEDFLLQHLSQK